MPREEATRVEPKVKMDAFAEACASNCLGAMAAMAMRLMPELSPAPSECL